MFKKIFIIGFTFFLFCYNDCDAIGFHVEGITLNKKVKSIKEIKTKNIVTQSLDYSCGAAGLSTLLNYYLNDPISEKEIINTLLKSVSLAKVKQRKGFSLLDLKNYAESKGYKVTGYQMDFDFLQKLNKPALVPIKFKNYRHFIIVKGVAGDRVFLADPAVGNITMKINRFEKIWTAGIGLVVEKDNADDKNASALAIKPEEALFADYKNVMRTALTTVIRTAVFPTEYK